MYEANPPLSKAEVLERYAHTKWESPQDDRIMAEVGCMQLPCCCAGNPAARRMPYLHSV